MFESNLYWSNRASQLVRQDKFGRGVPQILIRELKSPGGVRVYHQLRYNLTLRDPCYSAQCSHLCVAVPRGHRCLCPDRSPAIQQSGLPSLPAQAMNDVVCDATIEREKPSPKVRSLFTHARYSTFFSIDLCVQCNI